MESESYRSYFSTFFTISSRAISSKMRTADEAESLLSHLGICDPCGIYSQDYRPVINKMHKLLYPMMERNFIFTWKISVDSGALQKYTMQRQGLLTVFVMNNMASQRASKNYAYITYFSDTRKFDKRDMIGVTVLRVYVITLVFGILQRRPLVDATRQTSLDHAEQLDRSPIIKQA